MWPWSKKAEPTAAQKRGGILSTHAFDGTRRPFDLAGRVKELAGQQPVFHGEFAQDDSSDGFPQFKAINAGVTNLSETMVMWYASQGFIGAQLCGILAQQWLINKACSMPGDDAIRKGFNIVSVDGDELDPKASQLLKRIDRRMGLNRNLREFVRKGRIFGVRIVMFKVESTDQDYYKKPFNLDGVSKNSYKGMVQVDPYWTAPMLDQDSASNPGSLNFYEPTWWMINGRQVHRSHLIIFRHAEPVDVLKPQYLYGGVPLTQQIMERVYAAERTANEAPMLAMTKRTNVWLTNMESVMGDTDAAEERLQKWITFRDNYGIKLGDKEGDEFEQYDTSLADMDALIMTQYQLVAAIAGVPSTKLIGTSPKGFNATGEYEESSYHEMLESIQEHDLTPLIERHHAIAMRSEVMPGLCMAEIQTTVAWLPLDTPTAKELADTNLVKAQTGAALVQSGAIDSEDERTRVATDPDGGYHGLGLEDRDPVTPEPDDDGEEDPDDTPKAD
jgi:phage-related protein (TIGR01555 family)